MCLDIASSPVDRAIAHWSAHVHDLPADGSAEIVLGELTDVAAEDPIDVYRCFGGLIAAEDLVSLLRTKVDQPLSVLARWIVDGRVLSVRWQGYLLIPRFQFAFPAATLCPDVQRVIAELRPTIQAGELAEWFVRPNALLRHLAPVACVHGNLEGVIDAARADRFLSKW